MPNYVPYLLLIIAALPLLIATVVRERKYVVVAMHLSFAGLIYLFEIFVLVIFQGYSYHLEVAPRNYIDNMIGSVVSNLMTVPVIAVFIVFNRLRWPWMLLFALLLGVLDMLFAHLEIYQHHWWKSYYTVILAFLFFYICRQWIRKIIEGRPIYRYVTLMFYSLCVTDSLIFMLLLSGWRRLHLEVYYNAERDDVFFSFIIALCIALVIGNAIYWSKKRGYLIAAWIVVFIGQYLLYRTGRLELFVAPWVYAAAFFSIVALISVLCVIGLRSLRAAEQMGGKHYD